MSPRKIRFSVWVNCHIAEEDAVSDCLSSARELYEDHGFLLLPDSYDPTGVPTRLVINCHGAGGTVSTDDSQVEHQALTQYLVANGYAVMDVNGLPFAYARERGIDLRNNIGSPIAVRSYVKAYHYCMDHYNLKRDVFVHGGSMGGISSTNLVLSGCIPVIAHTAFCPVLDTYHQIFLHPWSDGLPKIALGKIYSLDRDGEGNYVYDENKILGCNPAKNQKALHYPVPVKFWHCVDDPVVSYEGTRRFVEAIRLAGGVAWLRSFPYGGHEPQLVGEKVKEPCGKAVYDGVPIELPIAAEEVFRFLSDYD